MTAWTYEVARALSDGWKPGDDIVVTRLDHDANVRPWVQVAERAGVTVQWATFDPVSGEMPPAAVTDLITDRTRLVAVTAASNLIGTRPDVSAITAAARSAGALSYVDGVHVTPHALVDVDELGADFYACSPYKWLGPHCGVVTAAPPVWEPLHPDKLLPSTNSVPERFEFGTLPYELLAGTTAAVDALADLIVGSGTRRQRLAQSFAALEHHETTLFGRLIDGLTTMPHVTLHGAPKHRTPTVLFSVDGFTGPDVHAALAEMGVNVPAGSFYAIETARVLGLPDTGAARAGLAPYTNAEDVDRLLQAVSGLA